MMRFPDAHGLIHVTREHDYVGRCGEVGLQERFTSTDTMHAYSEAARNQNKPVTCIACAAGGP